MNIHKTDTSLVETSITNPELMARWQRFLQVSETTFKTYTKGVRRFAEYLEENGISKPSSDDVYDYKNHLLKSCKPSTVQLYLAAIKQFFKWTDQEGIFKDIARHIKSPKVDKQFKKGYLSSSQAGQVLSEIDSDELKGLRDFAIVLLMVTTGLRTVEVHRANVGDIATLGDSTVLYVHGKGQSAKAQYVVLTKPVEQAIRKYLRIRKKNREEDPLFASVSNRTYGNRIATRSLSRIAKERMVDAGFDSPRLTAHSLRHSAAMINLLNGGTMDDTQDMMRHKSSDTTRVYVHQTRRAQNQSEQRITDAVLGGKNE